MEAVLSCRKPGTALNLSCDHWFRAHGIDVLLNWPRAELPNWHLLQDNVVRFLTCARPTYRSIRGDRSVTILTVQQRDVLCTHVDADDRRAHSSKSTEMIPRACRYAGTAMMSETIPRVQAGRTTRRHGAAVSAGPVAPPHASPGAGPDSRETFRLGTARSRDGRSSTRRHAPESALRGRPRRPPRMAVPASDAFGPDRRRCGGAGSVRPVGRVPTRGAGTLVPRPGRRRGSAARRARPRPHRAAPGRPGPRRRGPAAAERTRRRPLRGPPSRRARHAHGLCMGCACAVHAP